MSAPITVLQYIYLQLVKNASLMASSAPMTPTTLPSLLTSRTSERVYLASLATVPVHVILSDPSVRFQETCRLNLKKPYPRRTILFSQSTIYFCISSSPSLIFFLPLSPQIHQPELLAQPSTRSTQHSLYSALDRHNTRCYYSIHYYHSTCFHLGTCSYHIT